VFGASARTATIAAREHVAASTGIRAGERADDDADDGWLGDARRAVFDA
jgi:hypothetical protein